MTTIKYYIQYNLSNSWRFWDSYYQNFEKEAQERLNFLRKIETSKKFRVIEVTEKTERTEKVLDI